MALPINIQDLIHGHSVEWERLEFKQGWNPEEIIHSICAFANDLHNWGGGYIVVGIAEQNGMPVLPPVGLPQSRLDDIQGELIELGHKIQPTYFPIVQPYVLDGKHILVLWCPAGDNRPYTAPSTLGNGAQRQSYVRVGSRSIVAQGETLRRLQELTARIPFDDRINQTATIQDFDLGLIQAFLQEVKSDLYEESKHISLASIARSMLIAKGSDENLRPVNVGLLFFSKEPERFFPRTWIEVVWHRDDVGDNFTEHYFKGALHNQLRDALSFIKTNIIHEHVRKVPNQAEALRFYNFPYEAIEEALSNAVYHKGYDLGKPIEVQIWTNKLNILSYPGPIPPVDSQILQNKKIEARDYRNRRIGDFLKELDLTEGRGSGFPKIYKEMRKNGSPEPIIYTDEQRILFLTTLPVHPLLLEQENEQAGNRVSIGVNDLLFSNLEELINYSIGVGNGVSIGVGNTAQSIIDSEIHDRVIEMLELLLEPIKRIELFKKMALSNQSKNRIKYLDPLMQIGWITKEFPDKENNPHQRYFTTESGKKILSLIRNI